jgi:hypothetical protein
MWGNLPCNHANIETEPGLSDMLSVKCNGKTKNSYIYGK